MQDLGLPHWKIVKKIMKYLHGIKIFFFNIQGWKWNGHHWTLGLKLGKQFGHPMFSYLVFFSFGPCGDHLIKQTTIHSGVFYH